MSYILDAVVIVIVAVCAYMSARKGFVRTLIEFVGLLAAIFLSVTLASAAADAVYENTIRPAVTEAVTATITDSSSNALSELPDYIINLAGTAGISKESVEANIGETASAAAERIVDTALYPVAVSLIKNIVSTVLFVLLFIAVKLLARFLNSLFKGAILGTANRFFGAVLGGAKGLIYSAVFAFLVAICITGFGTDFFIFSKEAVNGSFIVKSFLGFFSIAI